MSTVTGINVLLDLRLYGKQAQGIDYAIYILKKRLEQLKGIDLYFLLDESPEKANTADEISDESKIMYPNSFFKNIDVYISSDVAVPAEIKKVVEITKYAVLDSILSCTYGVESSWFEDHAKLYISNYDYFITFSEKMGDGYLEKIVGIDQNRVIYFPLNYETDYTPPQSENQLLCDNHKKYCLALYRQKYYKEMEFLAKGFVKFLNQFEGDSCDLIFVLADLDEEDWSYKDICKIFKGHEQNLCIVREDIEDRMHQLIYEADAYFDIFRLEDINIFLLEELNYGRYIVSNSLITENKKIIQAPNNIVGFRDAIKVLYNRLHDENADQPIADRKPALQKDDILDTLFQIENQKRETPLVTIITITYNLINAGRRDTIQQCLTSVHDQTYKNIEHIIIDGASDDGTLDLLDKYKRKGWIEIFSEKDDGLYDAMNKGIRRAHGKYIAFLNSDDFYHDVFGVGKTVCALQKVQADYAFSDTNILNEDGSIYYWTADIGNLLYARNYCHQSMFTRLDVIKELNGFDLGYRVSSDSDLMIRIYAKGYSYVNVNYSFVTYRGGGLSAVTAEESRRDHSYSFFLHLGKRYSLTNKDCYELWQYRFFDELPEAIQARLIAKIPECFNSEMILNEYIRRRENSKKKTSLKKFIAQRVSFTGFLLSRRMRVRNGRNEMVYYFCKLIPIWVTKEKI